MSKVKALGVCLAISGLQVHAQDASQIEKLNQQLKQVQEQLDALKKQIEAAKTNAPTPPTQTSTTVVQPSTAGAPELAQRWSPSDPIRVGNAQNYLNLSFDALVAAGASTANDFDKLQQGGHDPKQRGFTVQNLEAIFDGKIDPYFRGQANVVLQIDPHGETSIEAEEAYLETMSLPWNLQVKAGQFFTEFGRLNPTHPHSWDFVDQPIVNGRFLGEDGLRSAGARISWLMPTPFYSELYFTVANSQGGTAFSFRNDHEGESYLGRLATDRSVKTVGDMLFAPRYVASFDLSDSETLVAGASAAFGPNSSASDTDTQIYGVDLFYKWKSPQHHAGFPFVAWQTEAMLRRFKAGAFNWDLNGNNAADPGEQTDLGTGLPAVLPRETITDWGLYSQIAYGFRKGWVAGLRGDYVTPMEQSRYENTIGRDLDRASRWRISPNLTYYPSEFSKIRLQYNYDQRHGIGEDHSVWLQFEFLLGTHAAHKF